MQASERSMLIEHILHPSMRDNLAIALDTANVIYDVQKQILASGARALAERVTRSDSGLPLRCVDDSFVRDPLARYAHLTFRRDRWPAGTSLCLEADAGGANKVFIGVRADDGKLDVRLQQMLTALHAGGAGNEHFPWWFWVAAPYDRWTGKEALLAFRSGEAVSALSAQILDVAAIIDECVAG